MIFLGKVGITLNIDWKAPKSNRSAEDAEASERALQFMVGWFAHPIYLNGDYSDIMKKQVAKKSKQQGLKTSRLPTFTLEEQKFIQRKSHIEMLRYIYIV